MPPEGESGPWGGGWKYPQAESPAVEKIIEDLDQLQSVEERGCDAFTIRTKRLHMQFVQHLICGVTWITARGDGQSTLKAGWNRFITQE